MKSWFTNIILLLFGLGSCTGSFYLGKSSVNKLQHWETAQAEVTGFAGDRNKDGTYPATMLKFSHEGKEYEFKSKLNSNDVSRHLPVAILFPKGDPANAEARQYGFLLGLPFALWFLGLVLCGLGYGSIKRRLKGQPETDDPSQLKPNPKLQGLRDYLQDLNKKS
jgi:hypothetical protein